MQKEQKSRLQRLGKNQLRKMRRYCGYRKDYEKYLRWLVAGEYEKEKEENLQAWRAAGCPVEWNHVNRLVGK